LITQAANAALIVGGSSSFEASVSGAGTAAADIVLGNANNNFSGTVNVDGANVTVRDADGLQLGQVNAAGDLTVNTAGDITMMVTDVAGALTLNTGGGNLTLGQTLVAGDTSIITRGGNINQTGPLNMLGDVSLDADTGAITLIDRANVFDGALTLNAGSTSLATSTDLMLGSVYNRGSLTLITQGNLQLGSATTVQGDLTLSSGGTLDVGTATVDGNLNVASAGSAITIGSANVNGNMTVASSGGDVELGATQIAGNLAATTSGGSLRQIAAMSVVGAASVDVGSGQLDLSNAQNDFTGAVSVTAASATIRDVNALQLGTLSVAGQLNVTASNDLNLGSGNVGSLTATSQLSTISQTAAGLTVTGAADFVAAHRIQLDSANNQFGAITAEAAWVTLNAASALQIDRLLATQSALVTSDAAVALGTITVTGDLAVSGAAGITQVAALSIGGTASFDSSDGDILLDIASNQFTGPVALAANLISVKAASALELGNVTAHGDLALETSAGPIMQALGTKLIAQANIALVATDNGVAADITLANVGNDFVGIVAADAANIKLQDSVGKLRVGNITSTGKLEAKATGGAIVLEPGTRQNVAGGMSLSPDPRATGVRFVVPAVPTIPVAPPSPPPPVAPPVPAPPVVQPPQLWPTVVPIVPVRFESLLSTNIMSPGTTPRQAAESTVATTSSNANATAPGTATAAVTLNATEQNIGTREGVIKVSSSPLVQSSRQVILVGKVIALDAAAAGTQQLSAATFEIVDGMSSGAKIEVDKTDLSAEVDNESGKVVLSGDGSVSDYDKAIQGIKLRVSDDAQPNAVIKIKITLTDGKGNVESKTVTVQVGQNQKISKNP